MAPTCIREGNSLGVLADELRSACLCEDARRMESLFRRIAELDEGSADAWYGLGMLSMQQGLVEDAYDFLSEFVAVAEGDRDAEDVEGLLCFLERVMSGGEELDHEMFVEIDERLLHRFYGVCELDEPLVELKGLTLREAVTTTTGKHSVLALIRENDGFKQAALERGLAVTLRAVDVKAAVH